jgi:hypothetical protein
MFRKIKVVFALAVLALTIGVLPLDTNSASAQAGVVYSDNMNNPAIGLLSEASPDPSQYSYEYKNGQYIAQAVNTRFQGEIYSFANTPVLYDSITAVDVGIGGADEREIYGFVGCRAGANDEGYMFLLEPTTGRAAIWRQDATGPVLLSETFVKHLVTPGVSQFNRIEIDCFLDLISGSVNGEVVVAVSDSTYMSGTPYVGIGNTGGAADNLFGVFDNLTITDQGGSGSSSPSPGNLLAGPLAGSIVEQATTVQTANANVNASDFFATFSFIVPNDVSRPWDVTIGFRDAGTGAEYRLTLLSTSQWQLSMGTGSALASGTVSNLFAGPGQSNTVELLVQGISGAVALNGTDFATLDLSASTMAGDIWIGTGTTNGTTQAGRSTLYNSFEVWSLV